MKEQQKQLYEYNYHTNPSTDLTLFVRYKVKQHFYMQI